MRSNVGTLLQRSVNWIEIVGNTLQPLSRAAGNPCLSRGQE